MLKHRRFNFPSSCQPSKHLQSVLAPIPPVKQQKHRRCFTMLIILTHCCTSQVKRKFLISIAMDWDAMKSFFSDIGQAARDSYDTCRAKVVNPEQESRFLAQVGQFLMGAKDVGPLAKLDSDIGDVVTCVATEMAKVINTYVVSYDTF